MGEEAPNDLRCSVQLEAESAEKCSGDRQYRKDSLKPFQEGSRGISHTSDPSTSSER